MHFALHTHFPYLLDLFMYVSFQLPSGAYSTAAISAQRVCRTHCHLCPTRYSFIPELIELKHVRWSALPNDKHRMSNMSEVRGEKHENPAPSGYRPPTAGSDYRKACEALYSNFCATSPFKRCWQCDLILDYMYKYSYCSMEVFTYFRNWSITIYMGLCCQDDIAAWPLCILQKAQDVESMLV